MAMANQTSTYRHPSVIPAIVAVSLDPVNLRLSRAHIHGERITAASRRPLRWRTRPASETKVPESGHMARDILPHGQGARGVAGRSTRTPSAERRPRDETDCARYFTKTTPPTWPIAQAYLISPDLLGVNSTETGLSSGSGVFTP
jgi:hypothetical protein